jgi:hypothetical protein
MMPLIAKNSKILKSKILNMTNSLDAVFFLLQDLLSLMSRNGLVWKVIFLCLQELTGAPLISYVPKNRRIKKKMR